LDQERQPRAISILNPKTIIEGFGVTYGNIVAMNAFELERAPAFMVFELNDQSERVPFNCSWFIEWMTSSFGGEA